MLKRMLLVFVCVFSVLAVFPVCSAEERKDEWTDKSFDFKAINKVVVQLAMDKAVDLSEIDRRKLEDLVADKVLKTEALRVTMLSNEQFEDAVSKLCGEDVKRLRSEDAVRYGAIMKEWSPLAVDAIMKIEIKQWGHTQVYVPERTDTYIEYVTTYVSAPVLDQNGKILYYETQPVRVPVERARVIPAHYEKVVHAGAEFSVTSAKTQQKIWILLDLRDANMFKTPYDMTERIFKRGLDQFRELTQSK